MPAATSAPVSLKEFDVSGLFVSDKATREASAATLSPAAREGAADTILALARERRCKSPRALVHHLGHLCRPPRGPLPTKCLLLGQPPSRPSRPAPWSSSISLLSAAPPRRSSHARDCPHSRRRHLGHQSRPLINPVEEVPGTIMLLSGHHIRSEVDSPTLSLMVPLLSRGLSEKLTATKRKVAVIVDNMSKLVDSPVTVRPFIPKLLPGLLKVETTIGDPEARGVNGKAIATLRQVGEVPTGDGSDLPPLKVTEASPLLTPSLASTRSSANFEVPEWDNLAPTSPTSRHPRPDLGHSRVVVRSAVEGDDEEVVNDDEEEGEDLCNCSSRSPTVPRFCSNTATLRLKRGHRYGLCGKNVPASSTLMRAITNGQVEGFPSPDEVRTFYVEHDIDGSEEDTTVLEFIVADKRTLHRSLSGGWKMKLALARAMLFRADILLLDEPTNHLEVVNLRRYRGNLEKFVQQVPEAKSYYTLEAAEDYKCAKSAFQYPTSPVQQLHDITLQVSLSSRVAVLGPNGSGKSTLVKLLIGDMEQNKGGEIWKHPNLVIGYVAQHAFHHIDNHLDKTPLEYMLEEEMKKMKDGGVVVIEGQKRLIDEILTRKKLKQSYEYEVSFKGLSSSENIWMPRDDLVKRGFEKKVIEVDTREAQRLGLLRPLVRREIEKHMADFGLEPEFVSHNTMRGLSGGQKVKIVLGAATWRRPHVMCLDEPTNYLDRESLAALIEALKAFEGGVLSICKEVWAMRDGRLEASGHNWVEGQGSGPRIDKADGEEDDQYDAMGNKIDTKKQKKITSSEARKLKKERMARKKRGEDVTDDEL
ncbi:hypothetical protein R3P38DRAFT_2909439 [Favolaschia claudopus]|uniref:ABC transporter domain-containing protein n=1 Tax=Favolaschia claudopus TaxID=2862362 RepID=A0AAW0CAD4_9AGAR